MVVSGRAAAGAGTGWLSSTTTRSPRSMRRLRAAFAAGWPTTCYHASSVRPCWMRNSVDGLRAAASLVQDLPPWPYHALRPDRIRRRGAAVRGRTPGYRNARTARRSVGRRWRPSWPRPRRPPVPPWRRRLHGWTSCSSPGRVRIQRANILQKYPGCCNHKRFRWERLRTVAYPVHISTIVACEPVFGGCPKLKHEVFDGRHRADQSTLRGLILGA
jgi:hypothetical protein